MINKLETHLLIGSLSVIYILWFTFRHPQLVAFCIFFFFAEFLAVISVRERVWWDYLIMAEAELSLN